MNVLIGLSIALWVGTAITQRLSIITVGSLVSTALFCSRKVGHFCKMNSLLAIEGICIFLTIAGQMMFGGVNWTHMVICLALRAGFIGVAHYDMTNFTYVKEVHRKE